MALPSPPRPDRAGPDGAPDAPVILIVDDERNIRRTLDLVLRGEGYEVIEAASAEHAISILEGNPRPGEAATPPVDVAILDIMLPGMSGIDLLSRLRQDDVLRELPVIVVSGHATVTDAVQAIRLGAADFFEKPLNRERILVSVKNALDTSRLSRAVANLTAQIDARYEMIGKSAAMERVIFEVERVAPTRASVLITGESGTGKELVSRAIHRLSARAKRPFVRVNCAAISHDIMESELFGHERGAFTGAKERKRGFFEQAHGGTLFLDEIGDMDITVQAKVLRVLQSGEVSRLGAEHAMHVDVRVLAATNKDLQKEVATGRFRDDLYFRLAVFPIRCPALRERMEDLRPLADGFLAAFCKENGLRLKAVDPEVYEALEQRSYPGNVRELKNVIERAAILAADVVTIADLPEDPHASPFDEPPSPEPEAEPEPEPEADELVLSVIPAHEPGTKRMSLKVFRERAERRYLVHVLASLDWNIKRAAAILGVERTNLHKKIRTYGIKRGETL
jgi:DNA-binding NtrC family response regulator